MAEVNPDVGAGRTEEIAVELNNIVSRLAVFCHLHYSILSCSSLFFFVLLCNQSRTSIILGGSRINEASWFAVFVIVFIIVIVIVIVFARWK